MSTLFSVVTANAVIRCTPEECEKLRNILSAEIGEDEDPHNFELEYDEGDKSCFIFAPEFGQPDALPEAFLQAIGRLLAREGEPHLEFGIAVYDTRPDTESTGGGAFRIMADGSLVWADFMWPGEDEPVPNDGIR
ncbi:MAG: hypothetical protein ACM3O6_05050 [Acidobacteriota bacterium]